MLAQVLQLLIKQFKNQTIIGAWTDRAGIKANTMFQALVMNKEMIMLVLTNQQASAGAYMLIMSHAITTQNVV
jgi:hypothetical protein